MTTSPHRSESCCNSRSSRSSSSSEEDKEEERSVATHTPLHRSKPLHRPASTYANKKKKGLPLKNRYPHHHQQFWPPLNPAPSSPPALAPYPHQYHAEYSRPHSSLHHPSGRRDDGSSASFTTAPGSDRSRRNYSPTTFGGSSRRRHAYTLQYTHTRAPRPKQETTLRGGGRQVQPPRHQNVIDGVDGRRWWYGADLLASEWVEPEFRKLDNITPHQPPRDILLTNERTNERTNEVHYHTRTDLKQKKIATIRTITSHII